MSSMTSMPGVFTATHKDGSTYYRVSITYKNKHISLGSYDDIKLAARAYRDADLLLHDDDGTPLSDMAAGHLLPDLHYPADTPLSFEKWVILINYRDNGMYFKTPIYIFKKFFLYFLTSERVLRFDVDDLFYYSTHKIMSRDGYLFVNDYGSQTNILSHYGIRSHAVCGRDYIFVNGDHNDFRYGNIHIINHYHGVQEIQRNGRTLYKAVIHIRGNFVAGIYSSEHEAAIAYNKAVELLASKGIIRNYPSNYIEDITPIEYARIYNSVRLSKKLRSL